MAILLVAALAGGCGGSEESDPADELFAYDQEQPLQPDVVPQPAIAGDDVKAVTYSGESERVPGLLAVPAGRRAAPCVVYMHGFGRTKEDALPLVAPLAELGAGVFAIDAPYHGARANTAKRDQIVRDPERLAAMLRQTVIDLRRGLDFLESRPECDPSRLGAIGFSMGALDGALLAGSDERVASTVLMSASTSWGTLFRWSGLISEDGRILDRPAYKKALRAIDPYRPERWVERIAPRPLLFINGTEDEVNPLPAARALQEAAGEGSTVFTYEGGHNPLDGPQTAAVGQEIADFLRRTLALGDTPG
jgi:pimeloyl-ACP methyl ester carboxylesterase